MSKRLLVIKWLLLSCLIAMMFKSTLLSSLVTTNYEKPVESADDLIKRELDLYVPEKTSIYSLLREVVIRQQDY
jgi:hypothetical protein